MNNHTIALLAAIGAFAGCASCGSDNNGTNNGATNNGATNNGNGSDAGSEADIAWKLIDAPADPAPPPCPLVSAADVPLLALENGQVAETFVGPAATADRLGIDYEVVGAPVVERVEVRFDFDPRLMLDDLVYEEHCLASIPTADLAGVAENDIVAAVVSTTDAEGFDARRGRVSIPVGAARANLVTDAIGTDDEEGEWYFVFEPATGVTRIMLTPADVTRTTFEQDGLPDLPGAIALIRTDEVIWNAATNVAYAGEGFAARWRERSFEWHGLLRTRGESADAPRRLRELRPAGATVLARPLVGMIEHDFDEASHLLLEAVDGEATLRVGCDQLPLTITAAGLTELGIDETTIAAGDTAEITRECTGTDPVDLAITTILLVPRPQHVVISRSEVN